MALALFAQIGLLAHLFSILVPVLGADRAGMAMGITAGLGIAGRTLVGWLMPSRANRRLIACASYGMQAVGAVLAALAYGSARRCSCSASVCSAWASATQRPCRQ